MTSDEQKRGQAVLRAALQRDPEERRAFLDEACAGRPWLRAEVGSLLDAPMDGRAVGPYIIRHEIGRGGMGVVYLADDTRLSRRVALKALSPGRRPGRRPAGNG